MNNIDICGNKTQTTCFEILASSSLCEIIVSLSPSLKTSQFLYYTSEELPNGSFCVMLWARTPSVT